MQNIRLTGIRQGHESQLPEPGAAVPASSAERRVFL
jgi:hypothetical protein